MKMARSKDGDGGGVKSALIVAEVQKRPILYDTNHQGFGERSTKSHCWEDVCAAVVPNWDKMSTEDKQANGKEIQKRWRSIRDSYTKQYRAGKCPPPASVAHGGGKRQQHQRLMGFLYETLRRKSQQASTDKRQSDTSPASPLSDTPIVIKQEIEEPKTIPNDIRLPFIDNAEPLELKAMLLESKADKSEFKTKIEARLQEVIIENSPAVQNPSLEIKIDANTILPEDHFYDDRLFMNSLLPFFKKMDDNMRLTCRIEVLKIIKYALQQQSRLPEEATVKDEVKQSSEERDNMNMSVSSQTSALRMCRKRKVEDTSEQSEQPAQRRRGPGRPRKSPCFNREFTWTYYEPREQSRMREERARRRLLRLDHNRDKDETVSYQDDTEKWYQKAQRRREERARRKEEARAREEDEEEMRRATSVTQLKPEKFFKMYNLKPAKKLTVTPQSDPPIKNDS